MFASKFCYKTCDFFFILVLLLKKNKQQKNLQNLGLERITSDIDNVSWKWKNCDDSCCLGSFSIGFFGLFGLGFCWFGLLGFFTTAIWK